MLKSHSYHIMETKKTILPKLKFKTLTEKLTNDEFDKLLSRFRLQIGREQMLKLICGGSSHSQLNALEGEILPIMQQRKSKKETTHSDEHAFTVLPATMIGEIASYLDQQAYARFSSTNRKMFVDCNSPNRLVALNLDPVEDFNFISLGNYRHLTSLEFALVDIDNIDYRIIPRCHRLQTLMLCGQDQGATDKLAGFIRNIDEPFSSVTTLALYGFRKSMEGNPLPPEPFVQLLTLFPALTHLRLHNIDFTKYLNTALLTNCCPLLNQLSLNAVNREASFLIAYKGRITTLALSPSSGGFIPPNLEYSKLRRLSLNAASQTVMNGFLKTSKNLEEICFVPVEKQGNTVVQSMSDTEIQNMTKKLIVDYKSLRFFHVSTRGHFDNICDSIQKGLYCTSNQKREFMEIGLTVDCREITDFDDFMCSVSRIIAGLTQSETEKWILSLEANRQRSFAKDRDSWEKAVSVFMTSFKTFNVELLFAEEWKYVFGSKGSSFMNAHHKWWNDCWAIPFY